MAWKAGCLQAILLAGLFPHVIFASFFTSSPGVVRTQPGMPVILKWQYNRTYIPTDGFIPTLQFLGSNERIQPTRNLVGNDILGPNTITYILYGPNDDQLGRYRCHVVTSTGNYSDDNAQVLKPGTPEPPHSFESTKVTAVSISLQWTAGSNMGPENSFRLKIFETGSLIRTVNIDGNGIPAGHLVSYKLDNQHGIISESLYTIELSAYNGIGTAFGPTITATTKALPYFEGEANVVISGPRAYITWPLVHPESVSHMEVVACPLRNQRACTTSHVSDPSTQPYEVSVSDRHFIRFHFEFFDGEERIGNHSLSFKNPDAVPRPPYNFVCSRTTAVSLHLEWRAGAEGSSPVQFFRLTYTNIITNEKFIEHVTRFGQVGDLVRHKLEKHIQPNQAYHIELQVFDGIFCSIGGPSIQARTKPRPDFEGKPKVMIASESLALITWQIIYPESSTHIEVTTCDVSTCRLTNITEPSIQPYEVVIPGLNSLTFTFMFYDIEDVVNERHSEWQLAEVTDEETLNYFWIIGICLGIIMFILSVFLLLCRSKRSKTTPEAPPLPTKENTYVEGPEKVPVRSVEDIYFVGMNKSSMA